MKSLTLTIFVVLASFVLLTHALEDDDAAFDRVMANLKSIAQKRARYCSDDFMDPIGLYCNYKRGLPRNRRSLPSRFDLE
uniref:Atrial natriuretic peptide transcript variant 2 n=1 Tax=Ophionotus victoriae TaxID=667017 RepID=A0A220W0C6_9ECHI|nr:atrial natriuretic peptide precursor transcript variant 2 [Ophionotus victoriae]